MRVQCCTFVFNIKLYTLILVVNYTKLNAVRMPSDNNKGHQILVVF